MEALVLIDYIAEESDELTIRKGEIIHNVVESMYGWSEGSLNGKTGLFPHDFVQILEVENSEEKWWSGKLQGGVAVFSSSAGHKIHQQVNATENSRTNSRFLEGQHLNSRPVAVVIPNSPAIADVPTRNATMEGAIYQPEVRRLDPEKLQAVKAKLEHVIPELKTSVPNLIRSRSSSLTYCGTTENRKATTDILEQVRQLQLKPKERALSAEMRNKQTYSSGSSFNKKQEDREAILSFHHVNQEQSQKPKFKPKPNPKPPKRTCFQVGNGEPALREKDNSFVARSASISGKEANIDVISNMMKGYQSQASPVPDFSGNACSYNNNYKSETELSPNYKNYSLRADTAHIRRMAPSASYFGELPDNTPSNTSRPTPPTPPPLSTKPKFKFPSAPSRTPPHDADPNQNALFDSIRTFSKDELTKPSSKDPTQVASGTQPMGVYHPDDLNSILAPKLLQRQKACIGEGSLDEPDGDEWLDE